MTEIISQVSLYVWGPATLALLFGTHIYLTFRTGFIQRKIFYGIRLSVRRDRREKGDVSPFGALATALASTLGTGNIIGIASAVMLGGPGAVLWIWLTGVFGIATKYSESFLAVKYRIQGRDGSMAGGPMYTLERGLGSKWLAKLFCIFTAIAAFGIGNTVQSNAVAVSLHNNYQIPLLATGLVSAVLAGIVILGGVQGISKVCTKLVPMMVVLYLGSCLFILFLHRGYILEALMLILQSAFNIKAASGGFLGSAMMMAARYGVARGLFANEAGLGSAPIVAAAAKTKNPFRQALVSATGTFWDTVVFSAITGIMIVSTRLANPQLDPGNAFELMSTAFASIPFLGREILTVALCLFAFSTILGWAYYGEKSVEYLFGTRVIKPYRIVWILAIAIGATLEMGTVWGLADIANALMALPNLLSLWLLSTVIARETKSYGRSDHVMI